MGAIEHRRAERFIIGDTAADAVGFQERRDLLHRVEESRHRGARVAGEQMHAAVDFQRAFDQ